MLHGGEGEVSSDFLLFFPTSFACVAFSREYFD